MMKEFSTRTIEGLGQHKTFKLIIPALTSFLNSNVNKEIEKDRQIILCAVDLKEQGLPPTGKETNQLLEMSREIDRKFLDEIPALATSIDIRYGDIEQFRSTRIKKILDAVYQILLEWDSSGNFRTAVASHYNHRQLMLFLREIFSLYINETRSLSTSVKIPRKLIFARNALIRKTDTVMEQVADELAMELADVVFSAKQA